MFSAIQSQSGPHASTTPTLDVPDQHAAPIHLGSAGTPPPGSIASEDKARQQAIRIQPSNDRIRLGPSSYVDVSKTFTVENDLKIAEVGMVAEEHLHLLTKHIKEPPST